MTRALALLAVLVACSSHAGSMPTDAAPGDAAPGDAAPGDGPAVDADTSGRFLHVSSLGVAFSRFPGRSVLTRTLAVHSAHGPPEVAWTAEADQAWLSVTASGMTGGSLVLTADPTGLAPDQPYTATVRVRSSDPVIRNEQDVRVGLWIGSADPQPVTLNISVFNLVADPVLPRLYTNTRGTDITAYDVYTGAVTRMFTAVVTRAGTMAISSDGGMLFVNDTATRQVVALDTTTGSELRRYPWASIMSSGLGYARPNAHPVLLIGNSKVFDVDTAMFHGSQVTAGFSEDASFAVDADDQFVYAQDHGAEPSNLRQYAIDYDLRRADPLVATQRHSLNTGVFGQTLCVAADGSRVYAANGSPSTPAFSAAALVQIQQLPGGGSEAACGWNGLFFGGDSVNNITVYRIDGTPLGTFVLPADAGSVVLSGDNTRIAGSSNPFQGTPSFSIRSTPSP